jgi:hypothetical protein
MIEVGGTHYVNPVSNKYRIACASKHSDGPGVATQANIFHLHSAS